MTTEPANLQVDGRITDPADDLLTITEAATRLRCSMQTVRRRIKSGELDAFLFAGSYKIRKGDVDAMLEASRR